MKNKKNHWIEDKTPMLALKKTEQTNYCRPPRNTSRNKDYKVVKYHQLKDNLFEDISDDEINIYINPQCEYNNTSRKMYGK